MQIAPPGLKGLAVADTALGSVRGEEGFFHYRQYDAAGLARHRTLEDVWTLQIDGALPPARAAIDPGPLRVLPRQAACVVDAAAAVLDDPMAVLRVGLLAVASVEGRGPLLDRTRAERRDDAVRLAAVAPTVLARHHRRRAGEEPVDPDPKLSHAADYLRMSTGDEAGCASARAVEQYLVATLDHGFNASTFTSRVVASTGADMAGSLVAGGERAQRTSPRRSAQPGHGDDRRNRFSRPGRIMGAGSAGRGTQDHGVRTRRVPS